MSDKQPPKLVLIDGSGYIFRAFFALPPMTRPDGTPVNAVLGFCNMIFRLMQDRPDDDLVVVFDHGRASFRNELYPDYKANRLEPPEELVPQFQLVREAARAFGLPVVEMESYEADDLIATYARLASEAGREALVVSSDKDLMQLVARGIEMWDPVKTRPIGPEEVKERFGVEPELVGDVLALAGDSSDNVPGVPGIGVKTAAQLLQEHGSLEALLEAAPSIKQPKRRQSLIEHADLARLSRRLVALEDRLDPPLPLEELHRRPFDPEALHAFLSENAFRSLIGRIDGLAEASAATMAATGRPDHVTIADLDTLDALVERAVEAGVLAIDTETTSLDVARARLVGISLAVEPDQGFYLPLGHLDEFGNRTDGQLDPDAVLERLRPVLADPSVLKIGHNLKYDMALLAPRGVAIAPIDDTMLISYVLDGASHGHSMDELARRHLGHGTIPYSAVCGSGRSQVTFDQVPIDKASAYAAEDAWVTLALHRALKPRIARERMATVYETLERPLARILAAMELRGIRVDRGTLERLSREFTLRMGELEAEAHKLVGRRFNLGSPKQLGEILFEEMGIEGGRKTKAGGFGTGADVLETLAGQGHELPQTILAWRQLQKLTRTYADALVDDIAPDGRVHTSYAMASTSTGRLSSTDPNLQNIPIRTEEGREIRKAFVAEDGHVLLSADYSQIELRVLAHMADIQALKKAFAEGIDVHAVTASQMFGIPVERVGPEHRRNAKTINYGIIYGIGAYGLAQRLGIPQDAARDFINRYFEQYPGIRDYMDRAKAEAREKGYVRTLWGRRCYVPEIKSSQPARRGYAERAAINAPIQGSAADIMKRAMVHLDRALARAGSPARMLLQVHDELVLEVPETDAADAAALVREVMASAARLSVPLEVDTGHGKDWDAAH
jgi:DNA polymerase I